MQNNVNLSENAINILNAIAKGNHSKQDIAEALNLSVPSVNGTLNSLAKSNLVERNSTNGFVDLTDQASQYISIRKQRTGTKMAKAREIFSRYAEKGRQMVLSKFIGDLDMSKAGASTYYQSIQSQAAYQRKPKTSKIVKTSKAKHSARGSKAR